MKKIETLEVRGNIVMMRLYMCFRTWWLRNLREPEFVQDEEELRAMLLWSDMGDDSEWIDRSGVSFLIYSTIRCNMHVIRQSLIRMTSDQRREILAVRVPKLREATTIFLPKGSIALHISMAYSDPYVTALLLEYVFFSLSLSLFYSSFTNENKKKRIQVRCTNMSDTKYFAI
jgi:hypothetical protein